MVLIKKALRREYFYDRIHRGTVWTCIGLSGLSASWLGFAIIKYYFFIKPDIKAIQRAKEEEMLAEGSPDNILLLDKANSLS